jgi:disulfide bond formation protein DsbB
VRFYGTFSTIAGILAPLGIVLAVGVFSMLMVPGGRAKLRAALSAWERNLVGIAALVALIAMSGSLYLSDVVGFLPCSLCWYQRIAMYPLVFVLGVGFFRKDPSVWSYALPLSLVGAVISWYHVLLQYRPSLEIAACSAGVPCTMRYMLVYGFVSIPVMAGSAFLLITACMLLVRSLRVTVPRS